MTIVFEVGFSESYDDLQTDMEQWFSRSEEDIQLVILVDIKKNKEHLKVTIPRDKDVYIACWNSTVLQWEEGATSSIP